MRDGEEHGGAPRPLTPAPRYFCAVASVGWRCNSIGP
jgi:hypothetical protein